MRALLRGERLGNVGVVLGLLAVLGLVSTLLTLVLVQSARLSEECRQRRAYDASSQHTRQVFRQDYLDQIDEARLDASISDELRARKIARNRRDIAALDETLGRGVHTTCGGLL